MQIAVDGGEAGHAQIPDDKVDGETTAFLYPHQSVTDAVGAVVALVDREQSGEDQQADDQCHHQFDQGQALLFV